MKSGKKTTGNGFDLLGKAENKIMFFSIYKTFEYFYIYYVIDNNVDY